MACRVGNQVDALRGMPGGKQLGHVGMGTLADDTDLIVQRREDVFVRLDAQRRTFVDLPQGGGDGRRAQDSLAAGNQSEDGRTTAQDGLIRLELTGEFEGALFAVLLGDEVKRIAIVPQDKAALPLGVGEVFECVGQFLFLHQLGVVHDTEDAIEIEQTRRVLRRSLTLDSVELRKLVNEHRPLDLHQPPWRFQDLVPPRDIQLNDIEASSNDLGGKVPYVRGVVGQLDRKAKALLKTLLQRGNLFRVKGEAANGRFALSLGSLKQRQIFRTRTGSHSPTGDD